MEKIERYRKIFGKNFSISLPTEKIWTIRTNTLKISVESLIKKLNERGCTIEQIPFYKEGLWVKAPYNLSYSIEHILGYFFIQNASSMIPALVLNPKKSETILDLCAAPGAKTTQIAAMMKNEGVIVANDVERERLKALRGNLQRCGVMNVVVTNMDGTKFWQTGLKFDKILLDVPCTGTGTLIPRVLKSVNKNSIARLSKLQKKLLISATKCLNDNGIIVYSTCSLEPEENEENVDFAVRKLGLTIEKIKIDNLNFMPALTEWEGKRFVNEIVNAIRIVPTERMEGFFICKLRKF